MKRMYFPPNVKVGKTGFIPGQINEVEETPGSVQRWLLRGCKIVEDEKVVQDEVVEDRVVLKTDEDQKVQAEFEIIVEKEEEKEETKTKPKRKRNTSKK